MFTTQPRINGSAAKLPATLAGLLSVAIADTRSLNRKTYIPNYNEWHSPLDGKYCEVCLAGCVIAGRLQSPPLKRLSSYCFDHKTENALDALDNMHNGNWYKAFDLLYHINPPPHIAHSLRTLSALPHCDFLGWIEFDAHLDALEEQIPALQQVDRDTELHFETLRLAAAFPLFLK